MRIDIRTNFPQVQRYIKSVGKQARYATAVALTGTAQDVRVEEKKEIARGFDRPTPYTMNALYLRAANVVELTAEVWLKDDRAGSGTPATRYLLPHIEGGKRGLKGFEVALQAHGLMPRGTYAVPASGVRLDAYGNVSKGTLVRILSQLRVQMTVGYESRATGSAASRRNVRKQGVEYFALTAQHGKLLPGIYGRFTFAHGSAVKPMFLYVTHATYKKRFKFFEVAERVTRESFPRRFEVAFAQALRTAR